MVQISEETQFVRRVVDPGISRESTSGGAAFGACHLLIAHEVRGVRFLHVSAARMVSIYAYGREIVCGQSVVSGLPASLPAPVENPEVLPLAGVPDVPLPALQAVNSRHAIKTGELSCTRYHFLGLVHWSMLVAGEERDIHRPAFNNGEFILLLRHSLCPDQFSTLASSILIFVQVDLQRVEIGFVSLHMAFGQ